MRPTFLLCLLLVLCGNLHGADDVDTTARFHDVPGDRPTDAVEAIKAAFPNGATKVRVVEVGDNGAVLSTQNALPGDAALLKLVGDQKTGGHLPHETTQAAPAETQPASTETNRPKYLPSASWRIKLFICRVVANASIAGAIILLKDKVHQQEFEWDRAAVNALVHGGVNGFFQWYGFKVADFGYANWNKVKFFPNFGMRLGNLAYRTLFNSWPKRVLCTIASVTIYRATDFVFTGDFEFSLPTLLGIVMNIGATLAPAALGLEMAARMGPPEAEGLDPRNNRVFDLQNLTISVLFAAALAINSQEMNQAFGIHGVWAPVYSAVSIGGFLWWAVNSRWTNPNLDPVGTFAWNTAKGAVDACGNVLGGLGRLLTTGSWRRRQ